MSDEQIRTQPDWCAHVEGTLDLTNLARDVEGRIARALLLPPTVMMTAAEEPSAAWRIIAEADYRVGFPRTRYVAPPPVLDEDPEAAAWALQCEYVAWRRRRGLLLTWPEAVAEDRRIGYEDPGLAVAGRAGHRGGGDMEQLLISN